MKKSCIEDVNELKAGAILSYVNVIISFVIPLFYTPIMLKKLGQAEYGLYSLSNSVISYLSLLTFGMGSAVIRYITKCRVENDKRKMGQIASLFLVIYLCLAGIVCLVGGGIANFSTYFFAQGLASYEIKKLQILLVIMTLSTAISFPNNVFSSIVIAHEKYIFRKIIDIFGTIIAPILYLIILYCGYATIQMALVGLGIQIFYLIVFFKYCVNKLGIRFNVKHLPFYMLKEILGFSIFVFMSALIDLLYWATDKILIGSLIGTVAVAVYNIGGTFTTMLQNMSSVIDGVFGTRVTALVLSKCSMESISTLLIRIGRLQYLIVSFLLSGYIVFGKQFIYFWAGPEYKLAYYVGLFTMLPLVVPLIQSIAFSTIVAQNKHQFRAIIYGIIAIVNIVATYFCIPKYGVVGAAICTGLAYIVGNGIIMNIYYYYVTKLNIPLFWKNILSMSVVPIGCIICFGIMLKEWFVISTFSKLIVYIGLYSIVFISLSWVLTMNNYEKKLIKDLVAKVYRKFV